MRATLPDRPGALAALAHECGAAGLDIRGLQVFAGAAEVTDELIVEAPEGWGEARVADVVARAGGGGVGVTACSADALRDQPERYVQAARTVIARPTRFPEVVAALFDAEPDPPEGAEALDVMELRVGDVEVQVRRRLPFTAAEHARGAAIADLVSDVMAMTPAVLGGSRRIGGGATPRLRVEGDVVRAEVDGTVVGAARVLPGDAPSRGVELEVDPAWRRRGLGTRLMAEVAALAVARGVEEIVLSTRADNQAVLPMVLAAGLRGRIRMAADVLTVRVPLAGVRALRG